MTGEENWTRESASLLILLDLLVTFSIIDHGFLLEHLSSMRMLSTILLWFLAFLEGRSQKVVDGALLFRILAAGLSSPIGWVPSCPPRCLMFLWSHKVKSSKGLASAVIGNRVFTQLYPLLSSNPRETVESPDWLGGSNGLEEANKLKHNPESATESEWGVSSVRNGVVVPCLTVQVCNLRERSPGSDLVSGLPGLYFSTATFTCIRRS